MLRFKKLYYPACLNVRNCITKHACLEVRKFVCSSYLEKSIEGKKSRSAKNGNWKRKCSTSSIIFSVDPQKMTLYQACLCLSFPAPHTMLSRCEKRNLLSPFIARLYFPSKGSAIKKYSFVAVDNENHEATKLFKALRNEDDY